MEVEEAAGAEVAPGVGVDQVVDEGVEGVVGQIIDLALSLSSKYLYRIGWCT